MAMSKHFFEGYSRSKDTLTTIANKMTSATIDLPWTVKSQGRIVSTSATYNDYMHVCMRKETPTGEIINLLFLDVYNKTATAENYGKVYVYMFYGDGCNVANDSYVNYPAPNYNRTSYTTLQYHTNSIADTEANPQFAWYWMWIDNESFHLTLFGNAGASGSATPDYNAISLTYAEPTSENYIGTDVVCDYDTNECFLLRSNIIEHHYEEFPSMKSSWVSRMSYTGFKDITGNNTSASNPDLYKNKFIVTKPKITQCSAPSSYERWNTNPLHTHTIANGSILFCNNGNVATTGLMRGDIVTIDEEGCDYVYQNLGNNYFHNNFLIKRAESAQNIVLQENSGNVDITVDVPSLCYGVKIVRKIDSMPMDINDGDIVIDENIDGTLVVGTGFSASDTAASAGNTYYYRAFAYDTNGTTSVPVSSATASIAI